MLINERFHFCSMTILVAIFLLINYCTATNSSDLDRWLVRSQGIASLRAEPNGQVTRQRAAMIKPRAINRPIVIVPVVNPVPLYTIAIFNHQQKPLNITQNACIHSNESLFLYCQKQASRDFNPSQISTTWETCCSVYDELACYLKHADRFCLLADQKSLEKYSWDAANYYHDTICRAISFSNRTESCQKEVHLQESNQFTKMANDPKSANVKNFINFPLAFGQEQTCFQKMTITMEGNMKYKIRNRCLMEALDVWDPRRRKLTDSDIWEPCCAMYDALDCVVAQADGYCSKSEIKDVAYYRKVNTDALTASVCRAIPYDRASKICRGSRSSAGTSSLNALVALLCLYISLMFRF